MMRKTLLLKVEHATEHSTTSDSITEEQERTSQARSAQDSRATEDLEDAAFQHEGEGVHTHQDGRHTAEIYMSRSSSSTTRVLPDLSNLDVSMSVARTRTSHSHSSPTPVLPDLSKSDVSIPATETRMSRSLSPPTRVLPDLSELDVPTPAALKKWPGKSFIPHILGYIAIFLVIGVVSLPLLTSHLSMTQTPADQAEASVGSVTFSSSKQLDSTGAQGFNDIVTLDLHGLGTPAAGKSYYGWLLEEGNELQKPLLLGKLSLVNGSTRYTYASPDHTDLLTQFSIFRITEEDSSLEPDWPTLDQTRWRYEGSILATPAPDDQHHYSVLSHLRHLLANDPTLATIGLSQGLVTLLDLNSQKILQYASGAHNEWSSNGGENVNLLRQQVYSILQYLDGMNYSEQDTPSGTPWLIDSKDGHFGILDITPDENPPGLLSHIRLHLNGLTNAPGASTAQKQRATQIDNVLENVRVLYKTIQTDAVQLAKMSDEQLRQSASRSLLDEMATKANTALTGQANPATAKTQQGINWIFDASQQMAAIDITTVKH